MRGWMVRTLLVGSLCLVTRGETQAVVPVFDAVSLAGVLEQVARTTDQLVQVQEQVRLLEQSARTLPDRAFGTIRSTVDRGVRRFADAFGELHQVERHIGRATERYAELINPERLTRRLTRAQRIGLAEGLHVELSAATVSALKAQAVAEDMIRSAEVRRRALNDSRGNQSEVAQLQIATTLLLNINGDLQNVVSVVAGQGRLAAAQVVEGVRKQREVREREKNMYECWSCGWSSPGLL